MLYFIHLHSYLLPSQVMLDLLHTSARSLVTGGRLAYLIPTTYDFSEADLPVHPCMQMVKVRN